jgi:hypothetical protein
MYRESPRCRVGLSCWAKAATKNANLQGVEKLATLTTLPFIYMNQNLVWESQSKMAKMANTANPYAPFRNGTTLPTSGGFPLDVGLSGSRQTHLPFGTPRSFFTMSFRSSLARYSVRFDMP